MTRSVQSEPTGCAAVDAIIRARMGPANLPWVWPIVRPVVNALVARDEAAGFVQAVQGFDRDQFFDYFDQRLCLDVSPTGLANVPPTGPVIIVGNHPTGAVDGLVLHLALKSVRRDLVFFSSTEALALAPGIEDCIIPVELDPDRWDLVAQRRMAKSLRNALRGGRAIVLLPAGALSVRKAGRLVEEAWSPSAVALAQRHDLPILPVHIDGRNSRLHYALHAISPVLRDLTTFRETLNKRGARFGVRIGELMTPAQLVGDPADVTERLRRRVMVELAQAPPPGTMPPQASASPLVA